MKTAINNARYTGCMLAALISPVLDVRVPYGYLHKLGKYSYVHSNCLLARNWFLSR